MIQLREIPDDSKRLAVLLKLEQVEERVKLKEGIPGRKWDAYRKYWTIPYTKDTLTRFEILFSKQYELFFKISEDIPERYIAPLPKHYHFKKKKPKLKYPQAILATEQELILMRYSYATIKAYKNCLYQFFAYYNDRAPSSLQHKDIKVFILHKINQEKIGERTQNQYINAIKFFFEKVLKKDRLFVDLNRPKKPKDLPKHLSPREVSRLLKAVKNIKHKAILMCIYAGGLRLSELINLKVSDIRSDDHHIRIQCAKGKKDRTTLLSQKLLEILRRYYKQYRPKYYLFEGQHGGQYSKRSVQNIMQAAVAKSKVRHATPHTLRHSFATHLVQSGVDISHVKELLGHNSLKTTEIYLHLSQNDIRKINNPLDKLDI